MLGARAGRVSVTTSLAKRPYISFARLSGFSPDPHLIRRSHRRSLVEIGPADGFATEWARWKSRALLDVQQLLVVVAALPSTRPDAHLSGLWEVLIGRCLPHARRIRLSWRMDVLKAIDYR
jgi:hypothetical protein